MENVNPNPDFNKTNGITLTVPIPVPIVLNPNDHIGWKTHAVVTKYASQEDFEKGIIEEVLEDWGNIGLNSGLTELTKLIAGTGGTAFNAANSRIGVGDGTTAVAATDTDLSAAAGSTHRQFKLVSQAPSVANQTITFVAIFGSGEGNFHWQEWMIDHGTADSTAVNAIALNHKLTDWGTKVTGAVWTFTVTITLA